MSSSPIVLRLLVVLAVIVAAFATGIPALRWHVAAMLIGESLTGFFAVCCAI